MKGAFAALKTNATSGRGVVRVRWARLAAVWLRVSADFVRNAGRLTNDIPRWESIV
jgi:hypothetical protein